MTELNVFVDPLQGAVFLICILTIPICTLATTLRLLNTKRSGRKINWEDWFALVALLSFWLHAALSLWTVLLLNGKDRFKPGALSPDELVTMSKVGYVMQLNFSINPTFAKLSLLALYHRIFSISRVFRYWVYTLGVLQIAWFLAIFLIRCMFCIPASNLWTPAYPQGCIDPSILLAAVESVNAAIAFVMLGLAISMVRTLVVSNSTKWKLRILFLLGGLTGVIDIISIIVAYGTITLNLTYFCLVTVQMLTNSICCCAPVYRTILPRVPFLEKLASKLSLLYRNRARSGGAAHSDGAPGPTTIVTIGGTVRKRGGGGGDQGPGWLPLRAKANRSGSPNLYGTDGESRADVEADARPLRANSPDEKSGQITVQRTFAVV